MSGVLKIGHNKSDLCRDGETRGKTHAVNTLAHTAPSTQRNECLSTTGNDAAAVCSKGIQKGEKRKMQKVEEVKVGRKATPFLLRDD